MTTEPEPKSRILDMLWEHLPKDREHKDRRQTGWGTKTKKGLIGSLTRIVLEDHVPHHEKEVKQR